MSSPALQPSAHAVADGIRARGSSVRDERERLLTGEREKAVARGVPVVPARRDRRVAPQPGEDEELAATRQVLANADSCSGCAPRPTTRCTKETRRRCRRSGIVWKKVGELAALDARFAPYLEARDGRQVAARGPRVLPALVRRGHRRLAGAAAGGRGPARAARASEEEARPGAGRRASRRRTRLRRELARHRARDANAPRELDAALGRARGSVPARGARRCRSDGAQAATEFCRGAREARSPTSRWRGRAARSGSRPSRGEAQWTERGIDEAEFYISPNPGEDLRPLARIASGGELSRIMLALKTLASTDAPGKTLIFDEVDAGIGGAVADVVGARLQRLADRVPGALHHAPAADRRATAATHFRISKSVRRAGRVTAVARLDGADREAGTGADDRRRRRLPAVLASAREMLATRGRRVDGGESGNAKVDPGEWSRQTRGESEINERRKRKRGPKVPDRNLRLPDERARLRAHGRAARAGRLRVDRTTTATPTSSSSTPAACASGPRKSCSRASARSGSMAHRGRRPSGRRRRRLRRAAGRRADPRALDGRRRRHRHAEHQAAADARRRGRRSASDTRPAPIVDIDPLDDVSFPLGHRAAAATRSRPTSRSSKAATSSAPSASSRTRAATSGCGRSPTSSPRRARRSPPARGKIQLLGQIVNHYQAPDDPACDFAGLLERLQRHRRPRADPLREPAPAPRHAADDRRRCATCPKVCRHLHLPVQSGSTRVLAAMRRRYTREDYLELVGAAARRHAGHRAIDRYDRRLPRRDRRRLRGDALADARPCAITACSRSSTRRGRTRSRSSGMPDDVAGGGEDAPADGVDQHRRSVRPTGRDRGRPARRAAAPAAPRSAASSPPRRRRPACRFNASVFGRGEYLNENML